MTGAEAIGAVVVFFTGGGAYRLFGSFTDRRKAAAEDREQKRQDRQAERDQERLEAEQARNNWQSVVTHLQTECANLRDEVGKLRDQLLQQGARQQEQAVSLARHEERARLLELQVQQLRQQLDAATSRHGEDARTIADLQAQLEATTDELEDARAEIIAQRRRLDELELLATSRSEPDYTPMGGPPSTDQPTLADLRTIPHPNPERR